MLSFTPTVTALIALLFHLMVLSNALAIPIRRGDDPNSHSHGAPQRLGAVNSDGSSFPFGDSSSAATETATATAAASSTSSAASSSSTSGTYTGGIATFFYQEGNAGACGTVHSDTDYIVAVDSALYDSSMCGQTVQITSTSDTSKSVTATIADECPGCSNANSLDLSVGAFEELAELDVGTVDIEWSIVS